MPDQPPAAARTPHEVIAEALARIAVAYPALVFAGERATEAAAEGFRRAVRLVRYQLRRTLAAPAPPTPAAPAMTPSAQDKQ